MVSPLPPGKVLAQSTVDERDLEKSYPLDHAILGDAGLVLRQLADEVARRTGGGVAPPPALATTREEVARLQERWAARWAPGAGLGRGAARAPTGSSAT